jgi:hypothetical protein
MRHLHLARIGGLLACVGGGCGDGESQADQAARAGEDAGPDTADAGRNTRQPVAEETQGALAESREPDCPLGPDGVATCFPYNPDPSCDSSHAKTGATCARDCQIGCGFAAMGTKQCTCSDGTYSECPCPRPDAFDAPYEVPLCTAYGSPEGLTKSLVDSPCTTEWVGCIGMDPVAGTTPQGCVCMQRAGDDALTWFCGSTNKWFRLEGT